MRRKKCITALCYLCIVLLSLVGCGNKVVSLEEQLVGAWYKDGKLVSDGWGGEGPSFTLYDDGTCEIAGEYGTGTWSIVNDNLLKLTNFYGESATALIISIEDGCLTLGSEDESITVEFWDSVKSTE